MPPSELEDEIQITLTRADALVLFELLARETTEATEGIRFADDAELYALWRLEGRLEKQLHEIISPDYSSLLAAARLSVSKLPAG